MCGIVGFTGSQNAAPILLDGLKKLEYRGYDSAGMAVLGQDGIQMVKTIGMIKNLDNKTQGGAALPGTAGIGHTRWATHGEPTDVNAHPHMSNDDKFAIVHNGIIENYAQLREELKAKGFQFKSETDTEVIVHLLDLYYEGDLKKAVLKTVSRLEGAYALGILCAEEGGRLIATRHAAPLIVGVGIGENYFASDVTALVAYTKNVIYLEDGEIADITPDRITVYDSIGKNLEKSITRIAWDIAAAEKGGYDHFMLKEIMEQPNAIKSTIEPRIQNGEVVLDDFSLTDEDLRQINKIMITACGSAFYAGSVGKYVMEELCRIPVEADLASELRYRNPLVDEHTLLVVVSQSGETADTIAAMKECKARGPASWPLSTWWAAPSPSWPTMSFTLGPGRRSRWPPPRATPPRWRCWTCWRFIWLAAWANWMIRGTRNWWRPFFSFRALFSGPLTSTPISPPWLRSTTGTTICFSLAGMWTMPPVWRGP